MPSGQSRFVKVTFLLHHRDIFSQFMPVTDATWPGCILQVSCFSFRAFPLLKCRLV
jgi:hypothetical protein